MGLVIGIYTLWSGSKQISTPANFSSLEQKAETETETDEPEKEEEQETEEEEEPETEKEKPETEKEKMPAKLPTKCYYTTSPSGSMVQYDMSKAPGAICATYMIAGKTVHAPADATICDMWKAQPTVYGNVTCCTEDLCN